MRCISSRRLRESRPETLLRLYFVTKGAVARQDGEAVALAQAPLWGLAQSLAVEYTTRWGGIVDLDAAAPALDDARQLFNGCSNRTVKTGWHFRAGRRYAARLQKDESAKPMVGETHFDADATYLLAGGLGGLGLEVARWLGDSAPAIWRWYRVASQVPNGKDHTTARARQCSRARLSGRRFQDR